ncbi:hypothetical protein EVAR_38829_1 [Eumeta japonica]|uniref:Uncharacterized protein n=1 Tax=Eumeta variegata TaxID=151549 RepID=A0A4C1XQQ6_EUMVA|nr:hypothetical protein EVAR_38829_1 [Eumeta japonica]
MNGDRIARRGEVGVGYRNSHPLYKIQQRKFKETSRSYSVRMWYFTDLAGKFLCHSPTGHSAIPYNNLLRNMQRHRGGARRSRRLESSAMRDARDKLPIRRTNGDARVSMSIQLRDIIEEFDGIFGEDGNDSSDYESSENSSDNVFINSSDSEEEVFFEPEVDPKSEDNNNIKCE